MTRPVARYAFPAVLLFVTVGILHAVPGAPTNLSARVIGSTVTLNWLAPAGLVTGYRLEAGTAPGLRNAANVVIGSTPTFTTTGVPPGAYYVRVRAIAPDGESAPSNETIVIVGDGGCTAAPSAPSNLSAAVVGSVVALSWTAGAGCPAASYTVYAGSSPGLTNLANLTVSNTGIVVSAPNGTYFVFVVAQNAYGVSGASNIATVIVGNPAPPPGPTPPPPPPPGPPPPPPPGGPAFGPGQWLVNTQIPPGRYYADPVEGCYWERQRGLSGSFDDIIANEFVGFDAAQWIVDIASSDVAFEADSQCGNWFATPRHGPQGNIIRPGQWLVGSQLTPGTYQVNARSGCYWQRMRSFSGSFDDIIDNNFGGGLQVVTILSSDAGFEADDECGTWTRTSADAPATSAKTLEDLEWHWRANYYQETTGKP